ncbi:hypothetical protein, partial [Burkholderia gladioli]
ANALATGAGAAVGGESGAFSGYNVDRFNRQLHPDETNWIKDNAAKYATQKGISIDQAVSELTAQANRQVQNGSPGAWDQNVSVFLNQAHGMLPADGNSGPGYMFYAPPRPKGEREHVWKLLSERYRTQQAVYAASSEQCQSRRNEP